MIISKYTEKPHLIENSATMAVLHSDLTPRIIQRKLGIQFNTSFYSTLPLAVQVWANTHTSTVM